MKNGTHVNQLEGHKSFPKPSHYYHLVDCSDSIKGVQELGFAMSALGWNLVLRVADAGLRWVLFV